MLMLMLTLDAGCNRAIMQGDKGMLSPLQEMQMQREGETKETKCLNKLAVHACLHA